MVWPKRGVRGGLKGVTGWKEVEREEELGSDGSGTWRLYIPTDRAVKDADPGLVLRYPRIGMWDTHGDC
jgi:hypothetical protein